ncbi:uncharacterized protein TM35_000041210 [Trypanosoma theileri]|uniref:Uncharacterized protein n=1 Tax=Trypanosoma theileri TaxID=67003 RepID=A0A1X0P4N5_9TRYP|nr:uncharacterized protein TM35_000041210 [Trypanosoma theileri]ORC91907.1 hypothetical protein TM35_000041210 [Trypanosoma theileri]
MACASDGEPQEAKVHENLEKALKNGLTDAYTKFMDGSGCFSAWKDVVEDCRSKTGEAVSAAKKTEESVHKIKEIRDGVSTSSEDGSTACMEYKAAVQEANDTMKATVEAIEKMTSSVQDTRKVEGVCLSTVNVWTEEGRRFNESKNYFSVLLGEKKIVKTDERMILAINSTAISDELTFLVGNLSAYRANSSFVTRDTGSLDAVKTALNGAVEELRQRKSALGSKSGGKCAEIKQQIEDTTMVGETKKKEIEKTLEKRTFPSLYGSLPQHVKTKIETAKTSTKVTLAVEMEIKVNKMVEEEKARRKEAERQEKERQKELEEEQKRLAQAQKEAEEEEARKIVAQKEAEKEEARKIEAQKEAKKEEARRVEAEKERTRIAEVANRAKEEEDKKVTDDNVRKAKETLAKKPLKGTDGTKNPALVPLPMMLFLLYVLGCTLVC